MRCPVCNGDVYVVDSGTNAKTVVRRRKCLECNHVFFTSETIVFSELGAPLLHKFKKDARTL